MTTVPAVFADPAHDLLRHTYRPLDPIFAPSSVAVVGATEKEGSVGRTVLWNLISSPFGGTVYPVNPKRSNVLGIRAYPSVGDIPEPVDLVVAVTPAGSVPGIIDEAVAAGVRGAIVISAGFKEMGPPGAALEAEILDKAHRGGMRIVGPNCLGVMNPLSGLNATFAAGMARPGNVGFLSQSGALCTAVLDWSFRAQVGFSAFVSIGSMLDVGWGDLITYLGNDPHTQSIVIYMESIGNARSFLSAAREVALTKPIIVIKAGRTSQAAKAAASHTGSLTGSDEVLDAAFRRSGVLRVDSIDELFNMAEVLGKQPRPKGPRLTILTNAGGPGVLATDALVTSGGELAELSDETMQAFNAFLPPHWSRNNPVDILGDASPERYARALEIAAQDPNSDGLLVILTPQDMTDPTQTAERLKPYARLDGKPLLASWMGGPTVEAGEDILNRANIPTFPYPDAGTRAFSYMWQHSYNVRALYETPSLTPDEAHAPDRAGVARIIHEARQSGRTLLTEPESKALLAAYGIPTVDTRVAHSADEAARLADELGYPVVIKVHSHTLTHKTDVGGVRLNIRNEGAVRDAYHTVEAAVREKVGGDHFQGVTVQPMISTEGYELIIGSSLDAQFGPVLLFGTGGQLVEVYKDRALGLPPLNATLARRMMEHTRIYTALKGVRGRRAVDLAELEQILVRFGQLVAEQTWIKECDINPLLASPERLVAVDARVLLHGLDVAEEQLPHPAIRPYPSQYLRRGKVKDGVELIVRPIRPEDEPMMARFHETLSERTVRERYFRALNLGQRVAHERLARVCFTDYDRELALVATRQRASDGEWEIVGVVRLSKLPGANEGEFAMVISDRWQNRGLGTLLLNSIVDVSRAEKLERLGAKMLPGNVEMLRVSEKVGFSRRDTGEKDVIRVEMRL